MSINQLPLVYDKCRTTLEKTSEDDDGACLLSSQLEVYNFDEVKKRFQQYHDFPGGKEVSSCDTLYIHEKKDVEFYLVEFKNSPLSNLQGKKNIIREKLSGSLLILTDIRKIGISKTKNVAYFILVYKDAKDLKEKIANEVFLRKLSFEKYENIYYKQCLILSTKEFQKKFVDQWENKND